MFDCDQTKNTTHETECGVKLYTRLLSKKRPTIVSLSPEIILNNGPEPGEIVEISGESGTEKSRACKMEMIAQTINTIECGGKGGPLSSIPW